MTKTALRTALRTAFGAGKYRITRGGDIHVHGQMPNSIVTGWYLWGQLDHASASIRAETLRRIEELG